MQENNGKIYLKVYNSELVILCMIFQLHERTGMVLHTGKNIYTHTHKSLGWIRRDANSIDDDWCLGEGALNLS